MFYTITFVHRIIASAQIRQKRLSIQSAVSQSEHRDSFYEIDSPQKYMAVSKKNVVYIE